jgi:hypothetical protein
VVTMPSNPMLFPQFICRIKLRQLQFRGGPRAVDLTVVRDGVRPGRCPASRAFPFHIANSAIPHLKCAASTQIRICHCNQRHGRNVFSLLQLSMPSQSMVG